MRLARLRRALSLFRNRPKPTPERSLSQIFASDVKLNFDMPGILFVEGSKRLLDAKRELQQVQIELEQHAIRMSKVATAPNSEALVEAEVDVYQGIGQLEAICGASLTNMALGEIALVAAAEAYVNSVGTFVLSGKEMDHFTRLNPVGKWLFLPRVMNLRWQPSLGKRPLQDFSELVSRRNQWIHPKVINTAEMFDIAAFLSKCGLDIPSGLKGRESVRGLIRGLCDAWKGSSGPDWLDDAKAKDRPPCFYFGDAYAAGRFALPGQRA